MEDIIEDSKFDVLVISYYFPPMGLSGVQRTLKFVKYLPDFDWNPVVLTTESNSSYYAYDETLLEEIPESVHIYRAAESKRPAKAKLTPKKFPNYFKQKIGRYILNIFKQPDTKIHWKKFAIEKADEIIKQYDIKIIYATAPPFTDFIIGKEIARKHNIPLVVDYRDNWVDNPFHFFPTLWHKNYNIKLEKDILTFSEKSFVITRYAKELLLKRYRFLPYNDVVILPHGYDPDDFATYVTRREDKKLIFTHSGLFQDDRTPKYFLKAMSLFLKENSSAREHIQLNFIGLMRPAHLKYFKKYKLSDISKLMGYINHREAVKELQTSDILWLTVNDTIRTPGKLYEYIGARKPIFFIGPAGQISTLVEETEAGFIASTKKVDDIRKQIAKIYNLWKENNLPKPSEENAEKYNRKVLTSVLARELSLHSKM